MLLSSHVRALEWIYTRQLPECQGTPCLKQARTLSDSNRIQNVVTWRTIHSGLLIYELICCGLESTGCHTKNMKKYLDPRQGSYFVPLRFPFSVFSQKIWYCCREQKKIIPFAHLLELAFLMFMKYCFVHFV